MKIWNRALFCTTAIGVLGVACAAMAADPATLAPGGDAAASGGSQEVVVTAEHRSERLEAVPASVSVVTPQTVSNAGITNFMNLGQVLNGVDMDFTGSVPGVSVRGVTSIIAGYNIQTNVAIYVDGFYDPQPVTMQSDLSNLQSIEALKGPQGALYGLNATGGAILINTLGPTRTFTGKFDASYGTYDDLTLNGYLAGPINDRVRFSISGHYQHRDTATLKASPTVIGATTGAAAHVTEADVRFKLQADLTDNLQATVAPNAGYHNDPSADFYSVFAFVQPPSSPFFYPLPPARASRPGTTQYLGREPYDFGYQYDGTVRLDYTTPIGKLTSYTGYADRRVGTLVDYDQTTEGVVISPNSYQEDTFQQAVTYDITAVPKLGRVDEVDSQIT